MGTLRTFLVTGAASGIGLHATELLVARGDRVVATDVDEARLAAASARWPREQVVTRALDVRDERAWDAAFAAAEALGGVDVLLNFAGCVRAGAIHLAERAELDLQIDVNVKGVALGIQAAARHMVPRGRGHVVNVSSLSALAPVPGIGVYSASKAASRALSLVAAYELRDSGVAVTVVCPDGVATPMTDGLRSTDAAALVFSGSHLLEASEVAALVVGPVLDARPLEVVLPAHRGVLARVANAFPRLHGAIMRTLERVGRRRLERLRGCS